MNELGLNHNAKYRKSATVVGEVLGKYHPHGDSPVYEALVRLAQDFAMRYLLVDGQGNFGSIDGDPPAAMRYTECKLAKISDEMLSDIDKETVDFADNFDGTKKEPVVLPSKLPNLLLNGGSGIAVGMATNIPPHNLSELIDAITFMISKAQKPKAIETEEKPMAELLRASGLKIENVREIVESSAVPFEYEVTVEDLMAFVKGPDFPTGGSIFDKNEITNAYATGKGKIVMRAKAEIEEGKGGKFSIIVTEIPYQVNKAVLITRIAELVKDKKLEGISDLRDESDRRGMRIVIELKRDAKPKNLLNQLYKYTSMQLTFNVNVVALVDGTPQTLTLKTILEEYIKHRQIVIVRRTIYDLNAAKYRAHILEGLKIALDHLDEVIKTIRESRDADRAKKNLMERFKLSEVQAVAILDMQLRKLAALERKKIEDEYKEVLKVIAHLEDLLASPKKILGVIETELKEIKEKYADARRTRVFAHPVGDFSEEDLVAQEETIVTITKGGYIKRSPIDTFRTQNRGGKGVNGMKMKEEDAISNLFSANTLDNLLFFTNQGRVFQLKVYELPEGSRISKGQAIINLINIGQGEQITSILTNPKDARGAYMSMCTRKGTVKKTAIEEFANIRRNGMIAINLTAGDELGWVKLTSGNDDLIIVTRNGMSIKFNERDVRPMGRPTAGVMGIRIKGDDRVVSMNIARDEEGLLVVMEKGLGKRTAISNWPKQGRGGMGVKAAEVTGRTGKIMTAEIVGKETECIIITSHKGQVIKLPIKSVPKLTRQTQGVILVRLNNANDTVAAVACLGKEEKSSAKESEPATEVE
ncbi:MAG: DNA gyrase subunit A [Patescibacteria group bacterium]|nr:DNA gyrase subunit A [Patescibacteria group bacterium]